MPLHPHMQLACTPATRARNWGPGQGTGRGPWVRGMARSGTSTHPPRHMANHKTTPAFPLATPRRSGRASWTRRARRATRWRRQRRRTWWSSTTACRSGGGGAVWVRWMCPVAQGVEGGLAPQSASNCVWWGRRINKTVNKAPADTPSKTRAIPTTHPQYPSSRTSASSTASTAT